jgi:tetratricopeptide (TPR) repeat protein
MVFIAEAFGGWLVSQVADAGRRRLSEWLLGTDQERALQQAATAAIQGTARELRPGQRRADDMRGADHLARVIDQVFQRTPTPTESLPGHATLLQGLKAGLGARLAILGDEYITGTGQSSAELLGVSTPVIEELLTHRLLGELLARGASGGPLAPLADQLNHDLTHLQGQQHSADLARLAEFVQSALATTERLDQARSLPAKATRPLGRAVHELIDPFALEVHRAIEAPSGATPLPALPTYVKRAHDRRLRAIIKRAASGRSAAAVLVGSSSTGKTRACWEAVQALPDEWQLWHPVDPSRPEAAADALPAVKPRTVIWLNDAQHYLLTPANGLGERVAAGLRVLLRDSARSPVLVLGTIWPEYWKTLTSQPDDESDNHAQARALLTGIDIPVPEVFSGSAVYTLQMAAKADPRLAEAASRAEDGRITQFLAGGPALLERYRNAPAPAKSLIEAAMDARRLGHSLFLPHSLLEEAASGYLTDQERDKFGEDWLEQALAYCAAPCRGARGPLSRVRARPVPAHPHYRLADYLEQAGRARRQTVLAPAALWDALVVHGDRRDLVRIAKGAERRSLYRHALQLYQRAADDGDRDALRQATELLERAGRTDEAVDWLQDAATTGHTFAMRRAAELLERAGRTDEAISLYQRAAEGGDGDALRRAVRLLEETSRIDEAIGWLTTRAVETDDRFALKRLAGLLEDAGRTDQAISLYQRAAEGGDSFALGQATALLEETSRIDEAIDWLTTRAVETSGRFALQRAGGLLERAGRTDEAISLYQRAAEGGDSYARGRAAGLMKRTGRTDQAIVLSKTRAEKTGDLDVLRRAAELLENVGRRDDAKDSLPTGTKEIGGLIATRREAEKLQKAGHIEDAISLYQYAAESGDPFALGQAVELLEKADRTDEAIDWLTVHADETGDRFAMTRAAELLRKAGRLDEAIDWLRIHAEVTGDLDALRRAAELLETAGRLDDAIGFYLYAAETGDSYALEQAAALLEKVGRSQEAAHLRQYGIEPGGVIATRWH